MPINALKLQDCLSLAKPHFLLCNTWGKHSRILEETVLGFHFFMFSSLIIVEILQIKMQNQAWLGLLTSPS